jgi:phosphate starvation-inducible PhoH-like protein
LSQIFISFPHRSAFWPCGFLLLCNLGKETIMAKRSNVRRLRADFDANDYFEDAGQGILTQQEARGWDPANDQPLRGKKKAKAAAAKEQQHETAREQRYTKNITPRSDGQAKLLDAIDKNNLVCALGPAGTGKTFLAITKAVEALKAGKVGRIVLSRPAVDAGENIGFLPGDMEDKLAPYLRPLYDALSDRLPPKTLKHMMQEGLIEIAPVAFMRGRTLNNAFVVIDEAQNCTYVQLKMLLTRLGWNSTMIVTGDPAQSDLLPELSGLGTVADKLEEVEDVSVVRLAKEDVVRHPLVAKMLTAL